MKMLWKMSVIQIENKAINEETEIYNFIKKLNI